LPDAEEVIRVMKPTLGKQDEVASAVADEQRYCRLREREQTYKGIARVAPALSTSAPSGRLTVLVFREVEGRQRRYAGSTAPSDRRVGSGLRASRTQGPSALGVGVKSALCRLATSVRKGV